MARQSDGRPLIAHVVFCLDYGGLENGVVNVINGLCEDSFKHALIVLTHATDFRRRILKSDVSVHVLNKQPGKDPGVYLRLFRLLRQLRPAIVHTRNLGTLEGALVARIAGVPCRIHGEHGWDVFDPDGTNRKYRALRRFVNPAIDRFITVSQELECWLIATIGIRSSKVQRICNGVDTERFRPAVARTSRLLLPEQFPPEAIVVGTVTRFSAIKDPLNVVRAFIEARSDRAGANLRLVMVGDGALRADAQAMLCEAGAERAAWLAGSRDDVPHLLRDLDVFVLGSRREGISNTVLEAMSTALPIVATATGGNLELVEDGVTGRLVAPGNAHDLAQVLLDYAREPALRYAHGRAARRRVEIDYSLRRMLADYDALYRTYSEQRKWRNVWHHGLL